jgi:hypothetical protein
MAYAPLRLDDSQHAASSSEHGEAALTLTILYKEKKLSVSVPDRPDTTVLDLKDAIHIITEIPPVQQRLLFAGKRLAPDNRTLSFFKVSVQSPIHLFPTLVPQVSSNQNGIPSAVPITATSSSRSSTTGANAIHVQGNPMHGNHNSASSIQLSSTAVTTAYNDNNAPIGAYCESVRYYSRLLLFLSYLSIFSTVMVFLDQGKVGKTELDNIVSMMDFGISIGGVYVAKLGMQAAPQETPGEPVPELVKQYSKKLGYLTMGAVLLRCLWCIDVIQQVKDDVADSKEAANNGTEQPIDPITGKEQIPLNDDIIFTIGMQAAACALIIIAVWLRCFANSILLNNAVNGNNPSDTLRTTQTARDVPVVTAAEMV